MYSRVFCVRTIVQRMTAQQPRRGVGSVSATEFMATIKTKPREEYQVYFTDLCVIFFVYGDGRIGCRRPREVRAGHGNVERH